MSDLVRIQIVGFLMNKLIFLSFLPGVWVGILNSIVSSSGSSIFASLAM